MARMASVHATMDTAREPLMAVQMPMMASKTVGMMIIETDS
jgi:predicted oxidoreductase